MIDLCVKFLDGLVDVFKGFGYFQKGSLIETFTFMLDVLFYHGFHYYGKVSRYINFSVVKD